MLQLCQRNKFIWVTVFSFRLNFLPMIGRLAHVSDQLKQRAGHSDTTTRRRNKKSGHLAFDLWINNSVNMILSASWWETGRGEWWSLGLMMAAMERPWSPPAGAAGAVVPVLACTNCTLQFGIRKANQTKLNWIEQKGGRGHVQFAIVFSACAGLFLESLTFTSWFVYGDWSLAPLLLGCVWRKWKFYESKAYDLKIPHTRMNCWHLPHFACLLDNPSEHCSPHGCEGSRQFRLV